MNQDAVKAIYSWQFFNCVKVWVLAVCQHKDADLSLLIHPLVQLLIGMIKLNGNLKFFPFHLKLFELLTLICKETRQLVPCSQYLLQIFEHHLSYFNAKPKALEDKMLPATSICLKISKKHIDTLEMKERIVREACHSLLEYYGTQSHSIAFPEIIVSSLTTLRKFKKGLSNAVFRKVVGDLLDKLQENADFAEQRRRAVGAKIAFGKRQAEKMIGDVKKAMAKGGDKSPLDLEL